ncbi:methyl-accepting chemotaxis protein [Paenibacillus sp. TRM 82003]|nr:methyl-accepting chemotaxis protein [Paenibacillus sp. TRM 82003]
MAELTLTAEQLLSRTEEGVSRSQQVAAAIEQVVRDNQANLSFLEDLEQQAGAVRGIVLTIREFSAQTNLLGLNAAIEAAHAGEHGRGFNIVASEVRKLANQVQQAAQEIQTTITTITKQIDMLSGATKESQQAITNSQGQIQHALIEFTHIGEAAERLEAQAKAMKQLL